MAGLGQVYRISAFELPKEHAGVCGGYAEVLVQKRIQIVLCLRLIHFVCNVKLFRGEC